MGRKKIGITQMTTEEIIAYAERVKQQNCERVKKHYHNTIKTDPEKYELWKKTCNEANKKRYYKRFVNEDSISTEVF